LTHRRTSRSGGLVNNRESLNSFDDSSVKNSQSGATDGGGAGSAGSSGIANSLSRTHKSTNLTDAANLNTISNNNNNNISNNNGNNKTTYMGSTDTLSRSINQRETLHSRFDFVKVLGKGTYGKVKLANDKRTGKQVMIIK
jgi:hypothetical protein